MPAQSRIYNMNENISCPMHATLTNPGIVIQLVFSRHLLLTSSPSFDTQCHSHPMIILQQPKLWAHTHASMPEALQQRLSHASALISLSELASKLQIQSA